jgi:hypothetical protein
VNKNAGAESTIESLLALQRVSAHPDAAQYIRYRLVGDPATSLTDDSGSPGILGTAGSASCFGERIGNRDGVVRQSRCSDYTHVLAAANPEETRLANLLAAQWNRENPSVQVRSAAASAGRSTEEVLLAAIVAEGDA